MSGTVIAIFTGESGQELANQSSVEVEQGRGIVGDRYHSGSGTFSAKLKDNPKSQITFISVEEITYFNQRNQTEYGYGEFRRNIVTSGVDLNTLVGQEFEICGARFLGIECCQPCAHLASLVDGRVLPDLIDRAGLRAAVLRGGELRTGAELQPVL